MQGQEDVVIRDDIRSFLRRQRTKLHGAQVNRIEYLTMAASVGAIMSLFLMSGEPSYLSVSLLVGIMAMGVDFAIEHFGITKRAWGYPHGRLSFRGVPLEVPFLFFCCGILVTYATYVLSSYDLGSMIFGEVISGTVLLQVLLLIVAGRSRSALPYTCPSRNPGYWYSPSSRCISTIISRDGWSGLRTSSTRAMMRMWRST